MSRFMKFDTRDKKPTVWNIAALTVIMAIPVIVLLIIDPTRFALEITLISDVYFLAVVILLVVAFFRQLQYNPYSYNTIYYSGFSLFMLSILITHINLTVIMITMPGSYSVDNNLSILLSSAKNYMLYSAPFILVFSIMLFVSNIALIRHEGKRLVNILGIILSILLLGGEAFLFTFDFYATGSLAEVRAHDLVGNTFAAFYLYFECMLIGGMIAMAIVSRHEPAKDKDFLIILGCGIQKDGRPSPLLRGRIDRALGFARQQKEQTGKDLIFITSGGQGPNEVISESASMKQYLLEQGVPEGQIIEEDRSTSTFENMKFSKEKIAETGREGNVAFSTTGYHVFRGGLYARRVKMRAVGIGAKTKWYFWPNAAVREFIGILTEHRGKQALILGSIIVIYVVLTLVNYRN